MEDGEWVQVRPPAEKELWSPSSEDSDSPKPLKLKFAGPAKHWTDAIPIGNGRLGAMVWGGVATETLQLNGKKIWTKMWKAMPRTVKIVHIDFPPPY